MAEEIKDDRIHMHIHWWELMSDSTVPAGEASIKEKTMIVGRFGAMLLSCGTSAWRVLYSMDVISKELGMRCTADIGLVSLNYTCMQGEESCAASISITTTGANTDKLMAMERFVNEFPGKGAGMTLQEITDRLHTIKHMPGNYKPWQAGLSAGIACFGFTFLLGGGFIEMVCALVGAGLGNWLRRRMLDKHISLIPTVVVSVAFACVASVISYKIAEYGMHASTGHEAGYICAMLFIIPGFPLITGGIDLAKSHMRSGLERMSYAIMIITVATLTGWIVAWSLRFEPNDFMPLELTPSLRIGLRLFCSFIGVYGFSQMFNSPRWLAFTAGIIGMLANTLRLELVTNLHIPGAFASFIGALTAGLLASLAQKKMDVPRISISVPSIVIMVPGMYLYRGVYNLGATNVGEGAGWIVNGIFMIIALPLGLVIARAMTDKSFRYVS